MRYWAPRTLRPRSALGPATGRDAPRSGSGLGKVSRERARRGGGRRGRGAPARFLEPAAGAGAGGEEEEPELEGGRRGERHCDAPLLWKRSSRRRGGVPAGFSR